MKRVNVKGITGAGKTTFALELARRLDLPYVEPDALFHGPNWSEPPAEEFRARVRAAMEAAPDGWVIDGNYEGKLGDTVIGAADTIVWLDLPFAVKARRLFRRTRYRIRNQVELWSGNREYWRNVLFGREALFWWMVKGHFRHRREWPRRFAGDPRFVRLRSVAEAKEWLERPRSDGRIGRVATTAPDRLHFTGNDEADELLARDPLALLIGFALDQQVPVQTAFSGPLKIVRRLGTLELAHRDPAEVEAAFREKPAVHRFPGAMAARVQELCALVEDEYGGDASHLWSEAADATELRRRISALPGFGEMKVKALSAVLAKRFGVEAARELAPSHPTLGDVDSPEALEEYQAKKRAYKAKLRAERSS